MSTQSIRFMREVRPWPMDHAGSRRASWLELFFDLIFVAAISQVGIPLGEDYSLHGLARYALMFLLIWWGWFGHTMYSTRFDADDVLHRLLTLAQIFAAAAMAANAKDGLASRDSAGFGAAYAVLRIILVIQYWRARREKKMRKLTFLFGVGFGLAALLWVIAALTPIPLRFWIWGVAALIDLGTPWLAVHFTHQFPPHHEHLPERFGLFTIILLGESVAAVMRGMESQDSWPPAAAISAFSGLAFIFLIWWWYFDVARGASERHVRSRRESVLLQIWSYAHFPLYLAIAVVGVGIEHVISLRAGDHLTFDQAGILAGGGGVLMMALTVIGVTSSLADRSRSRQTFVLCLAALPTPFLGAFSPCIPIVYLTVVGGLGVGLQAARQWRQNEEAPHAEELHLGCRLYKEDV
jgi:low temperature requirement protein LtrA